jgi:hypothetical protein
MIEERLPMPELGLSLGLWQGTFQDITKLWLRWFTLTGELIPEPTEEATQAKTEVAQVKTEIAQAKTEIAKLSQKLRELGINPDELDNY